MKQEIFRSMISMIIISIMGFITIYIDFIYETYITIIPLLLLSINVILIVAGFYELIWGKCGK